MNKTEKPKRDHSGDWTILSPFGKKLVYDRLEKYYGKQKNEQN